jgi:superfamily I DNA/RNA helicase
MAFRLTEEQEAVIACQSDRVAVTAYAGTGKTATLRAFSRRYPHDKMLYLTFSKAMQLDSAKAFFGYDNVEVRTIHSFAYQHMGKHYANKLDSYRAYDFRKYAADEGLPITWAAIGVIHNMMTAFLRTAWPSVAYMIEKGLTPHVESICASVGLFPKNSPALLISCLQKIYEDMVNKRLNGGHDLYLKLFQESHPIFNYKYILVDEAQDLNECILDIVLRQKAKIVFVGDPYQQIYRWNGAVDALKVVAKEGAEELYLTKSFRCPPPVADIADKYLQLLGREHPFVGCDNVKPYHPEQLVLARTNIALFDFLARELYVNPVERSEYVEEIDDETGEAFLFHRKVVGSPCPGDKPIFYNGGFDRYQFDTILDLYMFSTGAIDIKDNFIKKFKSFSSFKDYVDGVSDISMKTKLKIVETYQEKIPKIYQFLKASEVGHKDHGMYCVSTAHKAKGQEYCTVNLTDDYINIKKEMDDARNYRFARGKVFVEVSVEEINLLYVSMTRSFGVVNMPKDYFIDEKDVNEFTALKANGFIKLY